MTLYMIGLGLADEKDITIKGLEALKKSDKVFLEHYTAVLGCRKETLEEFYGKEIIIANRDMVESGSDTILKDAKEKDVAFLVVGDPFGATTHTDLYLRAKEKDINVEIIHNASIMNAIAEVGLELYKFGKTTSIVFDDDGWLPSTPSDVIKENYSRGLHTLCLLDIKVAEPSKENLKRGINKPEPPRFMTVNKAIEILQKIDPEFFTDDLLGIGIARLGSNDQIIKAGKIKEIGNADYGKEMHSLIIVGKLHEVESQALKSHRP